MHVSMLYAFGDQLKHTSAWQEDNDWKRPFLAVHGHLERLFFRALKQPTQLSSPGRVLHMRWQREYAPLGPLNVPRLPPAGHTYAP